MEMSNEYLDKQLLEAQQLLWSGSLHEVDQAHNIIANLIKDRQPAQKNPVSITKPPNLYYEKDITISQNIFPIDSQTFKPFYLKRV